MKKLLLATLFLTSCQQVSTSNTEVFETIENVEPAESCTVTQLHQGIQITCPNGTTATLALEPVTSGTIVVVLPIPSPSPSPSPSPKPKHKEHK